MHSINSKQGLNQNTVQVTYEDSYGFLWIGTQSGLHYYLGHELRLYNSPAGKENSLVDNYIVDISGDKTGNVWVASLQGVSQLNRASLQFHPVIKFSEHKIKGTAQKISFDQKRQALWILTTEGVYLWHIGTQNIESPLVSSGTKMTKHLFRDSIYFMDINNQIFTFNEQLEKVFIRLSPELRSQSLNIFSSNNQLMLSSSESIYELQNKEWVKLWSGEKSLYEIENVAIDRKGRLWYSSEGLGVYVIDPATGESKLFSSSNSEFQDNRIRSLLISNDDVLWIGTASQGIFSHKLFEQKFYISTDSGENMALRNHIRTIAEYDEKLILGHDDGLTLFEPVSKTYTYIPGFPRTLDIKVLGDILWVGTEKGLMTLDLNAFVKEKNVVSKMVTDNIFVRSLYVHNHFLLMGTNSSGILLFDTQNGRLVRQTSKSFFPQLNQDIMVLNLIVDSKNYLWIGTLRGLYSCKLNEVNGDITECSDFHSVIENTLIRDICELDNKTIWVASHSGLFQINKYSNRRYKLKSFTTDNGLPDNTVYSVLQDYQKNVWISSNKGLSLIRHSDSDVVNYTDERRLGQLEYNGASRLKMSNNNLVFGGVNGITRFLPKNEVDNEAIKKTWITSVKYGENFTSEVAFPVDLIQFKEKYNLISIEFSNSNLYYPETHLYRYRIDKKSDWVNLENRNQIIFAGLSPGKYSVMVQSKTRFSEWQDAENNIDFVIVELFWLSSTAKTLYLLLAILLLLTLFVSEYRRRRIQMSALNQVKESEDRLKMALKASGQGLWYWNKQEGKILRFNVSHLFNDEYEDDDSVDAIDNIVHENDLEVFKSQREAFLTGKRKSEVQYRVRSKNKSWRWIIDKGRVIEYDEGGAVLRAAGTYTDITDLKRSQLQMRLSDQVIQSMAEAVVVMGEDKKVDFVNPAFCRLTGFSVEEIKDNRLIKLRSSKHADQFYENLWVEFEDDGVWYGEVWMRTQSGKDILCSLEAFQLSDEELDEQLFVLIFGNITERRMAEEELSYLARYDTMTGLPNRSLLQDRLQHALALAKRHDHRLALMFMDLDGFKKINDSLGHQVGDLLLKNTAKLIQSCIRQEDTLARLSGDEFILLIEEYKTQKQLKTIARKILDTLQEPMSLAGHQVVVTSSLGISQFPKDASDGSNLMKFADTAMYHAKSQGKNQYSFYKEEMHEQVMQRLYIENHLRNAISNNELELVFQPIIDNGNQSVIALEALLRWNSAELGEVYPGDFIPLAEETGLIVDIGYFVIERVCQQIKSFKEAIGRDVSISVNVSVRQLYNHDFAMKVDEIIHSHQVNPGLIKLEITESMLMANAIQTQSVFELLKRTGVMISIDDFGTGYSSLSYLNKFEIDELKIDREFIADINETRKEEKIINAIVALAKSLDMTVVAEGVETEFQLKYLKERGCEFFQGYYFSRPLKSQNVANYIKSFK